MKKLILTLILTLSLGITAFSQVETENVDIIQETSTEKEEDCQEPKEPIDAILALESSACVETTTMYAKGEFEIKNEPNDESVTLDTSLKNTSFEVEGFTEDGLWVIIIADNGLVYMKSEHISETEILEPSYTEEELYIMAHLLAGECQSYPDEEQLYVGSVALNRVASSRFPNTLKEVVFQKGQYACTWDGNYDREPTERNWINAKYLLENGSVLPDKVIWQSGSKQGKGVYLKTKWHYFCY